MNKILEATHINKYFHDPVRIQVLSDLSFSINKGEFASLTGKSGCGKSTLLYVLSTMDTDYEGILFIDGEAMPKKNEPFLAKIRNEKIGFVFQKFNLITPLTALENVMLPLQLQGIGDREAKKKATEALVKVGMGDRLKNLSNDLSGGQQQRVAIARALVTDPEMMLCDEPTASLDIKSVSIVMEELQLLAKQGKAVAVVTHDSRLRPFADRIIYVTDGAVTDKPSENEILHQ